LYARGLTVREIQGYLVESHGTEVSPDLISTVTDSVLEVTAWQARPGRLGRWRQCIRLSSSTHYG
jgi:putative transposase